MDKFFQYRENQLRKELIHSPEENIQVLKKKRETAEKKYDYIDIMIIDNLIYECMGDIIINNMVQHSKKYNEKQSRKKSRIMKFKRIFKLSSDN